MRTTVAIDDELLDAAREYTGIEENAALIREALRQLVAHEAAVRLARMGGTHPDMPSIPRRRSGSA